MFICVECPSFYCLAPERGKAKNEGWGKRGTGPLSLDVTYLSGGQACNNEGKCNKNGCPPLCLHLCDQKQQSAIGAHVPNIGGQSFLPTVAPLSCMQTAPRICAQHAAMFFE